MHAPHQVRDVVDLGYLVVVQLQLGQRVQAVEVVNHGDALEAVGEALDVAPCDAPFLLCRVVGVPAQYLRREKGAGERSF